MASSSFDSSPMGFRDVALVQHNLGDYVNADDEWWSKQKRRFNEGKINKFRCHKQFACAVLVTVVIIRDLLVFMNCWPHPSCTQVVLCTRTHSMMDGYFLSDTINEYSI